MVKISLVVVVFITVLWDYFLSIAINWLSIKFAERVNMFFENEIIKPPEMFSDLFIYTFIILLIITFLAIIFWRIFFYEEEEVEKQPENEKIKNEIIY